MPDLNNYDNVTSGPACVSRWIADLKQRRPEGLNWLLDLPDDEREAAFGSLGKYLVRLRTLCDLSPLLFLVSIGVVCAIDAGPLLPVFQGKGPSGVALVLAELVVFGIPVFYLGYLPASRLDRAMAQVTEIQDSKLTPLLVDLLRRSPENNSSGEAMRIISNLETFLAEREVVSSLSESRRSKLLRYCHIAERQPRTRRDQANFIKAVRTYVG